MAFSIFPKKKNISLNSGRHVILHSTPSPISLCLPDKLLQSLHIENVKETEIKWEKWLQDFF